MLSLSIDGIDLMRRAASDEADPLNMASFPLVPYANRIAHGQFSVEGMPHQLPLNFGDHPHSIHGHGWQTGWAVSEQSDNALRLTLDHHADARWPWDFSAQQYAIVTSNRLTLTLSMTNLSDSDAPVGLGFHPYFLSDEATQLRFQATGLWLSSEDMLPQTLAPADALGDWSGSAPVRGHHLVDNAYAGWDGRAVVMRGDGYRLALEARGAPWLHVYRPPGEGFFCLEPVSHMPDAINRREGMEMLPPGTTRSVSMSITVAKSDPALPKSAGIA